MRRLLAVLAVLSVATILVLTLRPLRAESPSILYISGMRIDGEKPIAIVRLTNTSPNAADTFSVHYTIREVSSGLPLSAAGAGLGAQLVAGRTLELDLGKIVSLYRRTAGVGPYKGPVQFVAYGDGGAFRAFAEDTIHVQTVQVEGAAIHDGVAAWLSQ